MGGLSSSIHSWNNQGAEELNPALWLSQSFGDAEKGSASSEERWVGLPEEQKLDDPGLAVTSGNGLFGGLLRQIDMDDPFTGANAHIPGDWSSWKC
jgi:hypothetical protein